MESQTKIDANNMAVLLSKLQSGLLVFEAVFDDLESNYKPFADAEFREEFYREVSK